MIDYGRVRSTIRPEEKVVDEHSVWLNTNIQEVEVTHEDDTHIEYEFSQVQYAKDEYIKMIDERNDALDLQLTSEKGTTSSNCCGRVTSL